MSRSQGVHGEGSRSYTPDQQAAVVLSLRKLSGAGAVTVAELAEVTGVNGRAVRDIVADGDGVYYLLGGDMHAGYTLARTRSQACRLDARLKSQVARMSKRLRRRKRYAEVLL